MEVVHRRCAGLDISKRDAKVAVRVVGGGRAGTKTAVRTWSSMTREILALREHLITAEVTCVVMEATSDYWKPFYYVLEDGPWELMLVHARHARNMPGRKTDVSDAAWLAQLGAHGLVRGSLVPPAPIRALRDLTRTRTALTRERDREVQRLEKLLEDSGIKLSAVATDIVGVSGRAMLEAIDQVTTRIEDAMAPFHDVRDLICTIPGVSTLVADVIIAETGADMTRFPSAGHLSSWAGTCPGSNESAGRVKSTRTRPANKHLKGALGVAAMSAARTKGTYLAAKHRRIAARRGPLKAVVAVEHAMLIATWHMLTNHTAYADPGGDYYTRLNPTKVKDRAIDQLRAIGYDVTLTPRELATPQVQ